MRAGGVEIPLDCASTGYGEIPFAARLVIPRGRLELDGEKVGAASLPASVDHRVDGTEGPVRSQGRVGACTAFSFSAAVDHAVAIKTGRPSSVAATHVWARYHKPYMGEAASSNLDKPLAAEATWPYTGDTQMQACSWVDRSECKPCGVTKTCTCSVLDASQCGRPVDADALGRADTQPVVRVTEVTRLEHTDLGQLKQVLAKGQDVWMSMRVTDALDDDNLLAEHSGLRAVVKDYDPDDSASGHALLISGYIVQGDGTYFLLHNSWGERWGDKGYAWIHETTLRKNIRSAYVVSAEAWDPKKQKTPPRKKDPVQCQSGLAPDSVTGECVPRCPGGGARSNGVCPNPSDCPAGYVNLMGFCVPSPTPKSGTDVPSGVSYQCAAEGCTYAIPYGSMGCRMPVCMTSCPAPAYHLTTGPKGFSCSE